MGVETVRKRLATLMRDCRTLTEILNQLDFEHYFRGLMRVLSDESLAKLARDDEALAEITDYTRNKLADWHLLEWTCSANEQPLIIRACVRLEQLHRREGLEVVHPVFPFDRRCHARVRVAFQKKWHRLYGFHLMRLFRNAGPVTNPLTEDHVRWIEKSDRLQFRNWLHDIHVPLARVD